MDKTGVLNFSTSLVIFLATYLQLSTVNAEGHSLHYHFTTTSSPGPGQPSYHVGGYVDDVQVVRYTSDTRRVQPLLSCLEESMDPQLWVNQTQIAKHYEIRHQQTIHDIMRIQFLNQAKGHRTTYVFQVQFWCELSGDNSIHGYEEFAANGEDFIVLDPSNIEFVALISAAETITQTWNRRSLGAERQKSYLDHECVMWLKQYLPCMEERLGPVPPQVEVSDQQADGVTKLHCWVYEFYPRVVDVWWMKNEMEKVLSDEVNQILPNPDGTYQTRVTVEVIPRDGDSYSCHVDHSSLEEIIRVKWKSKTSTTQSSLHIGIYFTVALIVAIVVAVCRK